jgi:hypothetical protein
LSLLLKNTAKIVKNSFLITRTMDRVRKPNISESDTPSSESYSNYLEVYCTSILLHRSEPIPNSLQTEISKNLAPDWLNKSTVWYLHFTRTTATVQEIVISSIYWIKQSMLCTFTCWWKQSQLPKCCIPFIKIRLWITYKICLNLINSFESCYNPHYATRCWGIHILKCK